MGAELKLAPQKLFIYLYGSLANCAHVVTYNQEMHRFTRMSPSGNSLKYPLRHCTLDSRVLLLIPVEVKNNKQ